MSAEEYAATSKKKRQDIQAGRQFSRQPKKIAGKTVRHRTGGSDVSQTRWRFSLMNWGDDPLRTQ